MSERTLPTQLTGEDETASADTCPVSGHQQSMLGIETRPEGDRTAVVVTGEIDIAGVQALGDALSGALRRSVRGIDLDLSGVDFCDCSGLNVLVRVRRHARESGKDLAVRATSAAVRRLLAGTGTLSLFAVSGARAARPETEPELRAEIMHLERAMHTRPVIDLARGVLMASFGLSAEEAWTVLVEASQNTNTKLRDVAHNLVDAVNGEGAPEPVRQQVAATVTRLRTSPAAPGDKEE
ncbi:anti-sigma factor antagonist [Streptomyces sp. V4I2]|uniref:anti-sigma factor antagonist n=1 Tax=Streptomyces sp. V4I2 TaxID=3042280 RepID=UPI0027889EE7|nr:anti-sigma factor antagonist [Streptomyces sp. V4I2]MDQ1050394.1 anti-anti-sigma factor [Streptomyces sp. V4I2]